MNTAATPAVPAWQVEREHGPGAWTTREISFERGEGARLWDDQGRCYIDCVGGHGAAVLGHAHPALCLALGEQAARLWSAPPTWGNDQRAAYLQALLNALPGSFQRAMLVNSGTEAVEAALKLARVTTGRPGVLAFTRGFHGRTFGALSATHAPHYRTPFEPLVEGFRHAPYDNVEALGDAIDDTLGAVLVEVVQGEGGVRPASPEFLQALSTLCRERGALLIADEVQTGFGRTGRLLACEHHGVEPDIVCLAKGIAGGFPMGAIAMGPAAGSFPAGSHGSTFGGGPLACAVARATLQTLEREDLVRRAAVVGDWLRERLAELTSPRIRTTRSLGLMSAIELRERSAPYLEALAERGILALQAGPTVIRLLPPLVIERSDLEEVLQALAEVLA